MRQRYLSLALYGNTPLREQEKNAPIPIPLGRERKASWCHPNSGQTAPFGLLLREGNRGRFRPRSAAVLPPVPAGFSQREIPLCQPVLRSTAAASSRSDYHSRFPAVCQAIGRLLAGLTIMRQSRSPRARPRISISAVAMLLAKGTLLWSHQAGDVTDFTGHFFVAGVIEKQHQIELIIGNAGADLLAAAVGVG